MPPFGDSSTIPGFDVSRAPGSTLEEVISPPVSRKSDPNAHLRGVAPSYDITNTYDWTSVPIGSDYRKEAPSAHITAYQLDYGQLQQFIDGYMNIIVSEDQAEKGGLDPGLAFYKNLYKTTNQIANFNFPFFSDEIRSFTTEYADTFSPISQRGAKFMGASMIEGFGGMGESLIGGTLALGREGQNMGGNAISDRVQTLVDEGTGWMAEKAEKLTGMKMPGLQTVGAPGNYIETPQFYQYGNTDAALDINFVLSNTINGKEGYEKNQIFIKEFTKMNRPRRMGAIGMTFPAIYHIEVPGLRYIQWAFLANFSIGLMGARRKIDNKILPEAFKCNFNFRSLTMEAANFMDKVDDMAPYDTSDAGYLALRKKADDVRAKSLQDEKDANASRARARAEALRRAENRRRAEDEAWKHDANNPNTPFGYRFNYNDPVGTYDAARAEGVGIDDSTPVSELTDISQFTGGPDAGHLPWNSDEFVQAATPAQVGPSE